MNNNSFENLLFESNQQFQQLNQGFKEGAKKVGNSLGRIAKSTAKGASVGAAVGAGIGIASKATGNSQKGSVAVGAGIGAAIGGTAGAIKGTTKQIVNGTKKLFNKKPAAKKKMNQSINQMLFESQQEFTDLFESTNSKININKITKLLMERLSNNKYNLSDYGTPGILVQVELDELNKKHILFNEDKYNSSDLTWDIIEQNKRWFINFIISILDERKDKFELNNIYEAICDIDK